ncbi:hypothetical protein [Magnetospira sp. QH-2]|uniref:hypothetical protein n=1 Tax=Magnetospira sp. (strain QH-2) TaxID=1288970 RepID=UPI0003E80F91|nr:hypothetical protein [Magnetospira sp. QH-2]CCQ72378.1 protein of unknown function [Magnetospira sp. QH-2]CCQ74771.1 protein of unknown function [Magnetospira sp. QH-2]
MAPTSPLCGTLSVSGGWNNSGFGSWHDDTNPGGRNDGDYNGSAIDNTASLDGGAQIAQTPEKGPDKNWIGTKDPSGHLKSTNPRGHIGTNPKGHISLEDKKPSPSEILGQRPGERIEDELGAVWELMPDGQWQRVLDENTLEILEGDEDGY